MFSKNIKDETDLILEQERFMKSSNRKVVSAVSAKGNNAKFKKSSFANEDVNTEAISPIFTEIKERNYSEVDEKGEGEIMHLSKVGNNMPVPSYRTIMDITSGQQQEMLNTRKSIFAREMERLRPQSERTVSLYACPKRPNSVSNNKDSDGLSYLRNHGPQTISGSGLGCRTHEASRIHQENLERLAVLSEEEILQEREQILSSVDSNVIAFLLHKNRHLLNQNLKHGAETLSDKGQTQHKIPTVPSSGYPLQPDPKVPHMDTLEPEKLEWTLDLPVVAKQPPPVHLAADGTSSEMEVDSADVEHESSQARNPAPAPCQARFDLNGLVVPPEAIVDTHLGLHHHGEEPERAGYTVGELFHLARSSVPAQRRLALATLASSLAQSRRGRHVPHLAPSHSPSLIYGLMHSSVPSESKEESGNGGGGGQGGVAFLLRWCLDESISALTSLGTAAAGAGSTGMAAGISLGLLIECVRGLANLLADNLGEAFLSSAFVWPSGMDNCNMFLAPSNKKHKKGGKIPGIIICKKDPKPDEELDHAKAMSRDPISFLFTHGQLARRLAWLLADGPGRTRARLSADAAGCWLPALLVRGVRHSPGLAYKIFSTPELFAALMDNFLPEIKSHATSKALDMKRPVALSEAHGLPLPSMLQLCRLTMSSSSSIRLAMINDLRIVERCLSYTILSNPEADTTLQTADSLVSHLPSQLPLRLAFHLQIEALRCLTVCMMNDSSGSDVSYPIHALNLIRTHGYRLLSSCAQCWTVYNRLFVTPQSVEAQRQVQEDEKDVDNNSILVPALLTAWLSFFAEAFEPMTTKSGLCKQPEPTQSDMCHWVDQVFTWSVELLDRTRAVLHGTDDVPSLNGLQARLRRAGLTFGLIAVAISCSTRLAALQHKLDHSLKLPIQERLADLWNQHLNPLFEQRLWKLLLDRFQCNESVLTGSPETLADVDVVTVPTWNTASSSQEQPMANPVDWRSLPPNSPIDTSLLEPVSLTADCLPDMGAAVCFRYRVAERNLAALWWPKLGMDLTTTSTLEEGDTLSIDLLSNSRLQPLLSSLLMCLRSLLLQWKFHFTQAFAVTSFYSALQPLLDWIRRFTTKPIFPWLTGQVHKSAVVPHLLVAMESRILGQALLLFAQLTAEQSVLTKFLTDQLCATNAGNLLHQAALRLLPHLRANQCGLVEQLLVEIVFSPKQLDLSSNPVAWCALAPHLSKVVALYQRELTAWSQEAVEKATARNQPENHSDLLAIPEAMDESEPAPADSSVPVAPDEPVTVSRHKSSSMVNPLVPHDWVYAPLIGRYNLAKMRSASGLSTPQTEAENRTLLHELTDCLHWLAYLSHGDARNRNSPCSANPVRAGLLDPLSHLVRLCLGCLAYSGAGGLGFGESGRLLAQLIHQIEPISRLRERVLACKSLEDLDLPENCASFYDVYTDLLGHYAALSYNSPVFANLVLWPCQQLCHIKYRRALWGEHQNALVAVRLRFDQLLLPLTSFLEPEETDESVLRVYAAALFSGVVRVDRHPLLFLVAVHHLNRFLYSNMSVDKEFTKQFIRLLRISPGSRAISNALCGTRHDLLDLLRRYKQPPSIWLRSTPELLNFSDTAHLSPEDPLVIAPPVQFEEALTFWEHCTLAGLQCYEVDEVPVHRQIHWNKYFSSD